MAIIYTYPTKATPVDADLILISDSADSNKTKQVTVASIKGQTAGVTSVAATLPLVASAATGDTTLSLSGLSSLGTAGQVIKVNSGATALEFGTVGGGPGTGTQYSLPIWSTTSTLGDSLITQNSLGTVLNIGTNLASFSTTAGVGSVFATRLSVNGYSTFGGKLQLNSANGGTSVTLQGPPNSGTTYDLQLPNAVGTANQVLKLPATPGSTNQLVWGDATGGGVGTFTNAFGTYITGTANSTATGAVSVGTIDLSAVDGTSNATTKFLSKDNTWDVPSYTAASVVTSYTNANNNYILTSSGAGVINGESSLLYNGSTLTLGTNSTFQGSRNNADNVQTTNGIIELSNSSASAYGYQCNLDSNSKTTGANKHIIFRYDGSEVGFIRNDSPNSVAFSTGPSDERKKKNIVNWDDKILDSFSLIEPKKFNYLNESDSDKLTKGFIAQQMVDKFPEAYPKDPDIGDTIGYYSFNPSGMTVYLMKAVKELKEEIDSLKSRISTLEG